MFGWGKLKWGYYMSVGNINNQPPDWDQFNKNNQNKQNDQENQENSNDLFKKTSDDLFSSSGSSDSQNSDPFAPSGDTDPFAQNISMNSPVSDDLFGKEESLIEEDSHVDLINQYSNDSKYSSLINDMSEGFKSYINDKYKTDQEITNLLSKLKLLNSHPPDSESLFNCNEDQAQILINCVLNIEKYIDQTGNSNNIVNDSITKQQISEILTSAFLKMDSVEEVQNLDQAMKAFFDPSNSKFFNNTELAQLFFDKISEAFDNGADSAEAIKMALTEIKESGILSEADMANFAKTILNSWASNFSGFDTDDIEGILNSLKPVEVKGQPQTESPQEIFSNSGTSSQKTAEINNKLKTEIEIIEQNLQQMSESRQEKIEDEETLILHLQDEKSTDSKAENTRKEERLITDRIAKKIKARKKEDKEKLEKKLEAKIKARLAELKKKDAQQLRVLLESTKQNINLLTTFKKTSKSDTSVIDKLIKSSSVDSAKDVYSKRGSNAGLENYEDGLRRSKINDKYYEMGNQLNNTTSAVGLLIEGFTGNNEFPMV